MFLNVLVAVLATFIGFCLSTVFIKYNIIEPKAHFEKYGYKSPRLKNFHEMLNHFVDNYLNAFNNFDHKLYNVVHTVPSEEELTFLRKIQNCQGILDMYKNKRILKATDTLIIQCEFRNLQRSYRALEKIALTEIDAKTAAELENVKLKPILYPNFSKTPDSQIITVFDSQGRKTLWEYDLPETKSEEHV